MTVSMSPSEPDNSSDVRQNNLALADHPLAETNIIDSGEWYPYKSPSKGETALDFKKAELG
jgi:hypothetical protein